MAGQVSVHDGLETFLRGMETPHSRTWQNPRVPYLETFLRGMETDGPICCRLTPYTLKPSLEGWKLVWKILHREYIIFLETFLRGMETTSHGGDDMARPLLETFLRGMETLP